MIRRGEIRPRSVAAWRRLSRQWLWIGLCLSSLCGAGCATPPKPNLMGDNFHDEFAQWGESNRPADAPSGEFDGVSAKSQQIERNLGVR
jgi:hypothetical protein